MESWHNETFTSWLSLMAGSNEHVHDWHVATFQWRLKAALCGSCQAGLFKQSKTTSGYAIKVVIDHCQPWNLVSHDMLHSWKIMLLRDILAARGTSVYHPSLTWDGSVKFFTSCYGLQIITDHLVVVAYMCYVSRQLLKVLPSFIIRYCYVAYPRMCHYHW